MIKKIVFKRESIIFGLLFLPGLKSVCIVILLLAGSITSGYAQFSIPENRYFHFEGISGQKNYLVLDMHKFNDSIYGTYYHRSEGQLHYFSGKMNQKVRFVLTEKNGDSIIGEFISLHKMKGYFCNSKGSSKSTFLFSESDYFGSMSFETFRNSRTYDFADKPLFPKYMIDLLLLYPEGHPNHAVQDSVQDYILGYYFGRNILFNTREKMLEFLSNNYYQNYSTHYKANGFVYRSSLLKWSAVQDVQILFNENFVLSVCINQNVSNWNNDPLWDKVYLVFNLKTGQKISTADIFIAGFQEKLKNLLTTRLQKQFNVSSSLQAEGFYKQTITKYDNFFVTREGVSFHYNPGDIAPVNFGEIDLFFKFEELKEILQTKGLIYTLVQ